MRSALEKGIRHHRRGELDKAAAIYRKILKRHPREPDPSHLLGCIELRRNNPERAIALMRRAAEIAPQVPLYHENLAEAYHRSGRRDLAEAECRLALRFGKERPQAWNRLGVLAMEGGDLAAARGHLSEALRLSPAYAEALINMGAVLAREGEFDLAREACELAVRVQPENPLAWNNLGLARKGLGRREEAKEAFARAGDLPMARYNLGYMHLLDDDLERGLRLCEERKKLVNPGEGLDRPEWDGGEHPEAALLVLPEQGMGDTILMSRFYPELGRRFREVTVAVAPPLVRLVQAACPEARVVESVDGVSYDCWCPTMSVPHRLGIARVEDLPPEPWIHVASPGARRGPLRAGINWAGNPSFRFDRSRSTRLEELAPLLALPGVEWVSLHKGSREEEAERFGLPQPLREARDFQDTAEAIAGLDLVVSTETAVPNLSAAMGVPTLVLAAADHDWRWGAWCRAARVCAQDVAGDWSGAVEKAKRMVGEMARASSGKAADRDSRAGSRAERAA